ncbi:MAG: hypothetical protein AAFR51_08845 [Pseudomonadota bacterium]
MAAEPDPSRLRRMLDERDQGRSETRDEFNTAREDDAAVSHENAHLRDETDIDRSTEGRILAKEQTLSFDPVLAEKGQLAAQFDPAREDDASQSHEVPLKREEQQSGSQMVRDAGPRLEPRPPEEIEKAVKREVFAKRWAEEMERNGLSLETDNSIDQGRDFELDHERTLDRER